MQFCIFARSENSLPLDFDSLMINGHKPLPSLNPHANRISYASVFHSIKFRAELKFAQGPAQSGTVLFTSHFAGLDKLLRLVEGLSIMVEKERKGFLITDVKSCTEGFNPKWSNTLVYEVQTEQGDRLFLEMTIDVVKKFRTMPERLPPWLGRLGIWE